MRKTASVIIPVYKVQNYLSSCVDSVLRQGYASLEVILVDDGSPDGCGAICEDYARQDSRVRVIHKENGGLSSARNAGLEIAAGEYISFVDGDDTVAPDMISRLAEAIESTGADVALCDVRCVKEKGETVRSLPSLEEGVFAPEEIYHLMTYDDTAWRYVTAWNRLYRRELFDGLRFPEGKVHEDEFLAHRLYDRCRKIAVVKEPLYHYLQRTDSIMGSPVSMKQLDRVEARYDRYLFFREKGFRDLERPTLHRCYEFLWEVLRGVDLTQNKGVLRPWVFTIGREQLRRGDLHGAWLIVWFLFRTA